MPDRIWFHASIDELEQLVARHRLEPAVLGQVWQELTYRETERAKQLMREVLGLLEGRIPEPQQPPPPDDPGNQIDLL